MGNGSGGVVDRSRLIHYVMRQEATVKRLLVQNMVAVG